MKTKISMLLLTGVVLLNGCAAKQERYYAAVKEQNQNYLKAYNTVKNESVTFTGTFKGNIKIVKPKKLPQLMNISRPKSSAEIALDWGRVLLPAAVSVSGLYYGYKAIDSSNRANSSQIESYTGHFQNSTSNSVSTSTDKSVTANTDKSATTTNTTNTDKSTSVDNTNIPSSIIVDNNSTSITR